MNLCLVQRIAQAQRVQLDQLTIAGGAADSVLPLVEAWLGESTDHWNALRAISRQKADPGYRSVVDFVLVSVCPSLKHACFAFYEGDGPPLRDIATEAERRYYERRVLAFLELAYAAFQAKRRLSWSSAVEMVNLGARVSRCSAGSTARAARAPARCSSSARPGSCMCARTAASASTRCRSRWSLT